MRQPKGNPAEAAANVGRKAQETLGHTNCSPRYQLQATQGGQCLGDVKSESGAKQHGQIGQGACATRKKRQYGHSREEQTSHSKQTRLNADAYNGTIGLPEHAAVREQTTCEAAEEPSNFKSAQ
eukprot:CAMPEP_0115247138 /NCGR_PEP_ID=MMETSP0270-20121206/41391_1 /TAXON_ID=71861 /ORGANISM="Scrippsiella trochoidea, Strain CCMP3099" /LENGTH=123 /DNA_ID=CAMNT_0002662381 /DNA_START=374 /DNA_END=744 /DNA_ORIENTATION=+